MSRRTLNSRMLGFALVALALVANPWLVAAVLDVEIATLGLAAVLVVEAGIFGAGLYVLAKRPQILAPVRGEVLLAVGSAALMVAVLEGGARLWLGLLATPEQVTEYELLSNLPPEYLNSAPHHYLAYVPTPNYRKGLTVHNSLGYRDREFTVAKPQGVFRIVAMGGSTTYTSAVEDNNLTYPSQLGRILREEYGYESVEVINAGIGGHSSFESLMNLQFRVLDLHPDLIIIYHGTNDVHPRLVPPALYRGDNAAQRKQWRFPNVRLVDRIVFVRILGRLLGGSSQVGISALVDAPTALYMQYFRPYDEASGLEDPMTLLDKNPPVYFRRNLTNIIAVARANGVQVMLATWAHSPLMNDYAATAHYERGFREGNEVVRQVGARFGAPVFEFADVMPPDTVYWRDGRHVNEAGALKKAQLFAAFIHEAGLVVQPSAAPGGPVSN